MRTWSLDLAPEGAECGIDHAVVAHRTSAVANPGHQLELLAEPDVVPLHSRNVAYGCFMFAITRVP